MSGFRFENIGRTVVGDMGAMYQEDSGVRVENLKPRLQRMQGHGWCMGLEEAQVAKRKSLQGGSSSGVRCRDTA